MASMFARAQERGTMTLSTLEDLGDDEYELTAYGRLAGYSSQTTLRFEGLAVNALLDSGATCSAMPEEVAIAIISYSQQRLEEGTLTADSPTYPITLLHKFVRKARTDGVSAKVSSPESSSASAVWGRDTKTFPTSQLSNNPK